ncbi:MAG: squalene/phytoene synthase family protein [Methylocystaceae bacterium]|nr:squalene/phytoene synthase family protein [Methylocystaceae bacterium]
MTKTHNTENFPVASLLLAKKVRAQVLAFYHFARKADDIADDPDLSAQEKLNKLDIQTQSPFQADLLQAFRQDCTKSRYQTYQELLDYCTHSANPVGRFLLDVHNEETGFEASDALCTALQILNHLQDCQKDFLQLNRIYLPADFLKGPENYEELLKKDKCTPAFRGVLDQLLDETEKLIRTAAALPQMIKNKRLRYQAKLTYLCAVALASKLRKNDPLAMRVELTKLDKLLIAYRGLYPL